MKDTFGVPEIHDCEAQGVLRQIYNDIKYVLKVPVVNFFFRTLAWYECFLDIAWEQVRPNMLIMQMEKAAERMRYPRITVQPPAVNWLAYYDSAAVQRIKQIIFTFNYVNPKLLLIASAWAESLSERPIMPKIGGCDNIVPGIIPGLPEIPLVNINNAIMPVRNLLLDIAGKHHAFDVASDYRALACYPDFLGTSWGFLKNYVGSEEYNSITAMLKAESIHLAREMPFAVTVNRAALERIYSPQQIAGIMGIVAMFQNFIPGLIVDGEFFRLIAN